MKPKKKVNKISARLARNILNGTFSATAWIFETLIFAGVLTIDVFLNPSPYADRSGLVAFSDQSSLEKKPKKKIKETVIRHSLWRLQKQGFVQKEGKFYRLTSKGKSLADYILKRKDVIDNKWDNRFRVVIFDIPEKQAHERDWFRQELYLLNYKKLQESVFISKCPLIPELIKEIKRRKLGNFINYLLVDKVYKNIH
jgi:DNA-binding PadR family transcriptional regulator